MNERTNIYHHSIQRVYVMRLYILFSKHTFDFITNRFFTRARVCVFSFNTIVKTNHFANANSIQLEIVWLIEFNILIIEIAFKVNRICYNGCFSRFFSCISRVAPVSIGHVCVLFSISSYIRIHVYPNPYLFVISVDRHRQFIFEFYLSLSVIVLQSLT